ncbi:MAG: ABC transporter substrate-binding protein [Pseudomonadales bacterium]|nr:ABC transporter substrate-binding protein [Pseudomonadales bacterium]
MIRFSLIYLRVGTPRHSLAFKPVLKRFAAVLVSLGLCAGSVFAAHGEVPPEAGAERASDFMFFLEDEPVYTSLQSSSPGFMLSVVNEMLKRMKKSASRQFLPWNRAQLLTMTTPNAVIFPLTRSKEREDKYLWICKILDVPVTFVTKARTGRTVDSFEEARNIRGIGVIIGTPQEVKLREENIPYISFNGKSLYGALSDNRVLALYTAIPEAAVGWRKGGHPGKLIFGPPLQTLPLWIAANKSSVDIDIHVWQETLDGMQSDGSFARIFERYFETPYVQPPVK